MAHETSAVTVYCQDDISDFNHNICICNSRTIDRKCIVLECKHRCSKIVLTVVHSNTIDIGDIVVKSWVLQLLQIKSGSVIELNLSEFLNPAITDSKVDCIELSICNCVSSTHWNELSNYDSQVKRINTIPSNVNLDTFAKLLPALIVGNYICKSSLCCITILEFIVVFKCINIAVLDGSEFEGQHKCMLFLTGLPIRFKLITKSFSSNYEFKSQESCSKSPCCNIRSLNEPFNKLAYICTRLLDNPKIIPKSILVSGKEGSGKSYLLDYLKDWLLLRNQFTVINLSVSNYDESQNSEGILVSISKKDINTNAVQLFLNLVEYFDAEVNPESTVELLRERILPTSPIVILIDDFDLIFTQDSSGIERAGNFVVNRLDYLMRELLGLQIDTPMLIIAATRVENSQLQDGQSSRKFQTQITLPNLTFCDRKLLFKYLLLQFRFSLDATTLEIERYQENLSVTEICSEKLSKLTGGFTPGDIVCVLRKINNIFHGSVVTNGSNHSQTSDIIAGRVLTWKMIVHGLAVYLPIQIQNIGKSDSKLSYENGSRIFNTKWDDFCGYEDMKLRLRKIFSRNDEEHSEKQFINVQSSMRGIILHGDSGVGKTFLASIIASETNMNFISIKSVQLLSKYFSETESKIRHLFKTARSVAPCILFFDEFDAIASRREFDQDANSLNTRILSTFLNELDGIASTDQAFSNNIVVIVACVDIKTLDDALIRPGRLHYHFELKSPSYNDIRAMFERRLVMSNSFEYVKDSRFDFDSKRRIPCEGDVNLDEITRFLFHLTKPTGAGVISICKNAVLHAIKDYIASYQICEDSRTTNIYKVNRLHFLKAFDELG